MRLALVLPLLPLLLSSTARAELKFVTDPASSRKAFTTVDPRGTWVAKGTFFGEPFRSGYFAWRHRFYVAGGANNLTEETPTRTPHGSARSTGGSWNPGPVTSWRS